MSKGKILVIDDSELVLEITRDALREEGYDVVTNSSWVEVNATIREHRPDMILLDLMMPDVDGFAVLEWIRDQGGAIRCPVVVLTSSEHAEHAQRCMDLGASAFHRKPSEVETLGAMVREIVETWMGSGAIAGLRPVG